MDLFPFDEEFTMNLYRYGGQLWEEAVGFVTGFLGSSPSNNPITQEAYHYCMGLVKNTTLTRAGFMLLAICFLFDMIKHLCSEPERMHAPTIMLFFVKLGI